jgi:L-methionine (R)-S-oxide reductase
MEKFTAAAAQDKNTRYADLIRQAKYRTEDEPNIIANMANISAMVHDAFGFFWAGFYIKDNADELVLGPFQGPAACTRIPFGKGVCGTAWKEGHTVVVPDVSKFPGHIACSIQSRSEIVVPVFRDGEFFAVLDIDSEQLDTFDETDAKNLEELVKIIA